MNRWLVFSVFVLAFALRVVGLAHLPGGFTPDEASYGYDAYSLIKTGHDQWGHAWPLTFKSFGDYKLPLYTYIAIPSVFVFGLNEFAVRLPSAIFGTFAVVATYFLTKELLEGKDNKTALLATLFLAVSPWHMALSRGAFEANLTTFFMAAGMFFFLKARNKDLWLSLSMLFFGLNLFTYHSARLVTPLIVVALLWFYRKGFLGRKKYYAGSGVFLVFFVVSVITLFQGGGARAATSTIFGQNLGSGVTRAMVVNAGMSSVLGRVYYNEPIFKVSKFFANYVSYLSPSFLFAEGARETTYGMIPGTGVISLFELVGLIVFLVLLARKLSRGTILLLFWVIVGLVPAAISVGPGGAANRAAIVMPAIQIMSACGLFYFISHNKHFEKISFLVFVVAVSFFGFVSFVRYHYEEPVVAGYGMMSGMGELFAFLKTKPASHVLLSRSLSEPHIFAAFYDEISPVQFQNKTSDWDFEIKGLAWVDQQDPYTLGRYTISSVDKIRDFSSNNTLIVGKREEMPQNARIVKTILSPAGVELWVVSETQ